MDANAGPIRLREFGCLNREANNVGFSRLPKTLPDCINEDVVLHVWRYFIEDAGDQRLIIVRHRPDVIAELVKEVCTLHRPDAPVAITIHRAVSGNLLHRHFSGLQIGQGTERHPMRLLQVGGVPFFLLADVEQYRVAGVDLSQNLLVRILSVLCQLAYSGQPTVSPRIRHSREFAEMESRREYWPCQ